MAFTRCRWVVFTRLGWVCHRRVGFAVGLGIRRGWVSLIVIGLDLLPSGWIHRGWALFAVVGQDSPLLGSHSPSSGCIRPCCTQFSLIGPLTDIGCVGFAIVDPTCQCWVQTIAQLDAILIVSAWRGWRNSVRWKEKDDQKKNRSWLSLWPVFRDAPLGFLLYGPRTGFPYPWRFPFPLISLDLSQPRKSGVAHIPRGRGGARVFAEGSGGSWESQPTSQERGGEDGGVEVWRFVVTGEGQDGGTLSRRIALLVFLSAIFKI